MQVRAGMLAVEAARRFADRVALGDARDGSTFAALDEAANRFADGLGTRGVRPGERVAVLGYNTPELVETWLALERGGFVRVVLHSHFEMPVHVALLAHVGASAVVFDTRFAAALAEHRAELGQVRLWVAIGEDPPYWSLPYEELLRGGDGAQPSLDVDEDAPVCIQPTTGTTGAPKPWIVSHRAWHALVAHNLAHLDTLAEKPLGTDDVNLHVHAVQWASGAQTLLPYMLRGARTVLQDDAAFDPAAIVQTLTAEGVTGVLVPGPMLIALLDQIATAEGFEHRLRRLVTLFATPELLRRASALLGEVWCHGYGATEQGAPATRLSAAEARAKPARLRSVGRPASPFLDLRIVDAAGERLPAGAVGEIVVRSPMSGGGYWRRPDLDRESRLPGGWFRSRDLGYLDADGFLYYVDRARDAIETAHGTVFPHEIEAAVLRHAAVANCGAVGLGAAGAQEVVAAVVLKAGHEDSPRLAIEIADAAAAVLEPHARPRVRLLAELPTVLGGAKVQRELLREQLSAAVAPAS
ncbi:MAG TPA: class I adenylate-forming enzyme family protein [Solirubrobacteraceae bacterium]|nr:class I adenylate-forming enzyme family protein [Solirubrobacteraceae bacterium]